MVVLTSKDISTVEQRLLAWHMESMAVMVLDILKEWIFCTVVLTSPWGCWVLAHEDKETRANGQGE